MRWQGCLSALGTLTTGRAPGAKAVRQQLVVCILACLWLGAWGHAPMRAPSPSRPCNSSCENTIADQETLLEFAGGINNFQDVYSKGSWVGWKPSEPLCLFPWTCIACNPQGRVVNFTCPGEDPDGDWGNPLKGQLAPLLGTLDQLQYLDLSYNNLTGTLTPDWGQSLTALRILNLSGNPLTGTFPMEYGQNGAFPNLTGLDLSYTAVGGQLPSSWGDPNQPSGGGALSALKELSMDGCRGHQCLTGTLPPYWGLLLENLTNLNLTGQTGLTGPLPPEWGENSQFNSLRSLSLANTLLSGTIPGVWFNNSPSFNQLRTLELHSASLSGTVPHNWSNKQGMPNLQYLYLQNNNLSGSLPDEWPPSLKLAAVAPQHGPGFCGTIPPGFPAVYDPSQAPLTGRFLLTCAEEEAAAAGTATHSASISQGGIAGITVGAVGMGAFFTLLVLLGIHQYRVHRSRGSLLPHHSTSPPHSGSGGSAQYKAHAPHNGDVLYLGGQLGGAPQYVPPMRQSVLDSLCCGLCLDHASMSDPHSMRRYSHGSGGPGSGQLPLDQLQGPDLRAAQARAAAAEQLKRPSLDDAVPDIVDWEIQPEDIEICKRLDGSDWTLGSGAYGMVYKATLFGVHTVAIKKLHNSSPREQENFRKEVTILKGCRNANIVMFLGACLQPQQTMLVTEFMPRGDLWHALGCDHTLQFSWYNRGRGIALDIARGLHFMHRLKMVHFDLKSPNILLARDHTAKIADVGLSKIVRSERTRLSCVTGTWDWAAPEMLRGEECSAAADIYSFGVVLWELCTGERPLRGNMPPPRVPEQCPQIVSDLILRCRSPNPLLRPTSRELCDILKQAASSGTPGTTQPPAPVPPFVGS